MTLEEGLIPSKQFDVWQRLYKRYLLEPFPLVGSRAAVGMTVQPVTQADELLRVYRVDVSPNLDLSPASGADVVAFTVPADERWLLTWLQRGATIANSTVTLTDGASGATGIFLLVFDTAFRIDSSIKIMLSPNSILNMRTTGDAGDTAITMNIATVRETIF